MAFTKITAAGIGTTETVTVDGLTVINDGSFGGNLTVAGVLTYEDVTNVDSVGLITARNGIVVGSGITLSKDGDGFFTGIVTATSFSGSGANLTGIDTDLVSDTSPQLGGDLDTNSFEILLDDNHAIKFGDDNDLQIKYDSSSNTNEFASALSTNFRGKNLYFYTNHNNSSESSIMAYANGAVELYHDSSKKLETGSGGVVVTGQMYSNSAQIVGDAGGDATLNLFSDGGSQDADKVRIRQTHVGNSFLIESYASGAYQSILKGTDSRTIELHYQGSKKIETQSGGVEITGKLSFANDNHLNGVELGADGDVNLYHDNSDAYFDNNTGDFYIRNDGASTSEKVRIQAKGGEQSIICSPNGAVQLYHDNAERLATFSEGLSVHVAGNSGLRIIGTTADVNPRIVFRRKNNDANNSEPAVIQMTYQAGTTHESGHLDFFTNGDSGSAALTQRMRISNDGNIFLDNTFSTTANNQRKSYFTNTGQQYHARNAHEAYIVFQDVSGNNIGNITRGGGASIAFNTSSDYRLKENVVDLTDAITRLKTLSPKRFNFKSEPSITMDGFLAHEVTAVPEAIEGEKDGVITQAMLDAGTLEQGTVGDPIYQGIDQSKLVPLLTAALQEAVAKIETLETKVAALEG